MPIVTPKTAAQVRVRERQSLCSHPYHYARTHEFASQVEQAFNDYGAAPGGKAMMLAEMRAAEEAIASKVYITWRSEKTGADCSRVSSAARCFCGHALGEHAPVNRSNPRPPACTLCDCKRF
eukprot:6948220-Prymnesium_polylepis.1